MKYCLPFLGLLASLLLTLSACLILLSNFSVGGYHLYVVVSGSMLPLISPGSVLVVYPEDKYEIGEVISFRNPVDGDHYVTHRILSTVSEYGSWIYRTKGDANSRLDLPVVKSEDITGKVLVSIPRLGSLITWIHSLWGFVVMVMFPGCLLIGMCLLSGTRDY